MPTSGSEIGSNLARKTALLLGLSAGYMLLYLLLAAYLAKRRKK